MLPVQSESESESESESGSESKSEWARSGSVVIIVRVVVVFRDGVLLCPFLVCNVRSVCEVQLPANKTTQHRNT